MSEDLHSFRLQVMSANGIFYDGEAIEVVLPCDDGEHALLAHHEEMIVAVYDGILKIKDEKGNWIIGVVSLGSAQFFSDNSCIILVNTVERPEEIDKHRAQEAYEFALDHLKQQQTTKEYNKSVAGLSRAKARLDAANKYKK